jgi:glycyl-tRNA synthetase alpha chain
MTFLELIIALEGFWAGKGCVIQQAYDLEVGALIYDML